MLAQEREQGLEALGGAALADDDHQAGRDVVAPLVERHAFMVGRDAGGGILPELVQGEARGVAVDRLAGSTGCVDFAQDLRVFGQHAGEIHHFAQVADIIALDQLLDVVRRDRGAAGLDLAADGGDAARCAEKEVEPCLTAVADHEIDAVDAQDIRDLVRVGDDADGAVGDGDAGVFAREEHRTLNVDVAVDEARQQVWP